LRKGDATLIDSAAPWSSDCLGDCARLYLRIPQPLIESQLGRNELPFTTRISGDSGFGAILYHLSTSLFEQADSLSAVEGVSAMEGYLRILAGCVGSEGAQPGANRILELSTRIMNYIETHLTESTLGPVEIASALRISVRHV